MSWAPLSHPSLSVDVSCTFFAAAVQPVLPFWWHQNHHSRFLRYYLSLLQVLQDLPQILILILILRMITLWTEIISVLKRKVRRRTSTPVAPPRKVQPSCWKNSFICFMMGPQLKLTGPSLRLIGISTEVTELLLYNLKVSVLCRIK